MPFLKEYSIFKLVSPKSMSLTPPIPYKLLLAVGKDTYFSNSRLGITPTYKNPFSFDRQIPICCTYSLRESWKIVLKTLDYENCRPKMPFSLYLLYKF